MTVNPNNSYNLPWTEKYRPNDLSNVVSHDKLLFTLNNLIENNKFPHLLFYGPPGTGKTSSILACANQLYGEKYVNSYIMHLNASDERGIDLIRKQIKDFCVSGLLFQKPKPKLVILDEADSMTIDAQLALRQIVVNNTEKVRFCLICNYVNKIIEQLQSRFSKFRFKPINTDCVIIKLKEIASNENIKCDNYSFKIMAKMCKGDMRKLINIFQAISIKTKNINKKNIHNLLKYPTEDNISEFFDYLFNKTFKENYIFFNKLIPEYMSFQELLKHISEEIFNLKLSNITLCEILKSLSQLEYNTITNNNIQICTLISVFIVERDKNNCFITNKTKENITKKSKI